jgi:hypothetical protein
MTEKELRDKVAGTAEKLALENIVEWNDKLQHLIDVYNACPTIGRGIAYKPSLGGWCALFVSDCFIFNGLEGLIVPEIGAYEMMANAKKAGQWKARGSYIPKRGDIVVFGWQATDKNGKEYTQFHTAVVTNASASDNILYTTEGNVSDRVIQAKYYPSDKKILGYWAVDYASTATPDVPFDWSIFPAPPTKPGRYTPKVVVSNNGVRGEWE